ncbi:MAG: hypothetical protein KF850_04365 [Labilithrix sp.]|nr:hypothetical protein [Labilithrix sp.]
MLRKSFSLATVVALSASLVWVGCSSDDPPGSAAPGDDAGNTDTDAATGVEDAGDSGPVDTGAPEADTPPPMVDVTYGTCPAFAKCGGDIAGSWKVSGGCVSSDAFAEAKQQCPAFQESDVVIKANGTVVATATNVVRKTTVKLTAKLAIPKACTVVTDCGLIAAGLKTGAVPGAPKFETATCTEAGALCNCDVSGTLDETTDDTYTTADGVVTTTNPTRTFDYCVDGNKTTYVETTPPAPNAFALPIFIEISK